MPEETDIRKMKVSELRAALEKRGLNSDGLKADLINRLQQRLDEEEFGLETNFETTPVVTATASAEQQQQVATKPLSVVSNLMGTNTTTAITTVKEMKSEELTEEATPVHGNKTNEEDKTSTAAWTIDTNKVQTEVNGITEASLEEKKRLRAERFGIPLKPSTVKATEKDTDDELLNKLEEDIKKAKRMGLTFKDLIKKKNEIIQKRKKSTADNQEVEAVVDEQNRKRDGHVRNDDVTTNSKKQRVGQQVTKEGKELPAVDALESLPLPELQKRLDRAKKFNLESAAVDKIKEAIIKKPLDDLDSLSKEELQKRLDRAEKFKSDQATIDKIKAALRKFRFGGV